MSFIRPALCALVLLPCLAHADDSDKALAAECAKVPGYVQQGEAAYKARLRKHRMPLYCRSPGAKPAALTISFSPQRLTLA
jgi:hypothetical protein